MKLKDLRKSLRDWKELNKVFFKEQLKNVRTGKQELQYSKDLIPEFFESYGPVFFLSTGRCGTKYLANILQESPVLDVYHHAFPELLFQQQFAFNNPNSQETKSIIEAARTELLFKSMRRNRKYVETNNRLTFFAYALAYIFPKAKFIHVIRHPVDFIKSGLKRNWYSEKVIDDAGRIIPEDPEIDWQKYKPYEKIAWLWNATNQFIEDFKAGHSSQIYTFKSEDLFTNTKSIEELIHIIGEKNISTKMRKKFKRPVNVQLTGISKSLTEKLENEYDQIKDITPLFKRYHYYF